MRSTLRNRLTNYNNPNSLGSRMRAKRAGPLLRLIESTYEAQGRVRILDVGGRQEYWRIVPPAWFSQMHIHITLLNLPSDLRREESEHFSHRAGDACDVREFGDNAFDIVHSNSVIEHVGGWDRIQKFAAEANRLAPSHFIQTPYYWFPIEPHYVCPFFHWLPLPWQIALIRRFTLGSRGRASSLADAWSKIADAPRLLDLKTFRLLFPNSTIMKERFFLLVKSMIAVRSAQ